MWGWAAALEDNRERWEPFPRTGGDEPSRPEQRATSSAPFPPPELEETQGPYLRAASPAEQVVSGERGGSDAAKRGAERRPTKNRTRPLGALHPSLAAQTARIHVAATELHASSWRTATDSTLPLAGRSGGALATLGWGLPGGHDTNPQERAPTRRPRRRRTSPQGRYEEGDEDVQCAFTPAPVRQRKSRDSQAFAAVDWRRFEWD